MGNLETLAAQAAKYHTGLVKAHDEKEWKTLEENAAGLLKILAPGADDEKYERAGILISSAYQFADVAEIKQRESKSNDELFLYEQAAISLAVAYHKVGLPSRAAEPEVAYWLAFRHKDTDTVSKKILETLQILSGKKTEEVSRAAELFAESAWYHKTKDWAGVTAKVTEAYKLFLPLLKAE